MAGQATLGHISEAEFNALLQALSSTSKGRAFLEEYRHRYQPEDTLSLLGSLNRIEATMGAVREQLRPERIAEELRNIAMGLELAMEGARIDSEGEETERRFALADRARHELQALAATLAGGQAELTVVAGGNGAAEGSDAPEVAPQDAPRDGATYKLRDPAAER